MHRTKYIHTQKKYNIKKNNKKISMTKSIKSVFFITVSLVDSKISFV